MAGLAYGLRNAILNHILRGPAQPSPRPSQIWAALLTTNPISDDGTGAVEVGGGLGYVRQQIMQLDSEWGLPVNGATDIVNPLSWGPAINANWGRVIGIMLMDAMSGGSFLGHFPLVAPGEIFRAFTTLNAGNWMKMNDHPYTENEPVFVFGQDLPPELDEGTEYWFQPDTGGSPNPDNFRLRSSFAGPIVTLTPQGGGLLARSAADEVDIGQTFALSANDLRVALTG